MLFYGIVGLKKNITAALQTEHLELLCHIEIIYFTFFLAELLSSPGVRVEKL